jgi:polyisoprenoid-binding protein YceI
MKSVSALTAGIGFASLALSMGSAQAQPVTYKVDPAHTFATFEVVHFGTSTVRGRFNKVDGTITVDRGAGSGRADITVHTGSIDSGVPDFDKHLKTADFFDAEKMPTARFQSEQFRFEGDKLRSVSGTLSLLGKSQPVTLEAQRFNCYDNPMLKTQVCGGDFETTLERSKWGMNWGIDMGIPDKVRIVVQIEAAKQ